MTCSLGPSGYFAARSPTLLRELPLIAASPELRRPGLLSMLLSTPQTFSPTQKLLRALRHKLLSHEWLLSTKLTKCRAERCQEHLAQHQKPESTTL